MKKAVQQQVSSASDKKSQQKKYQTRNFSDCTNIVQASAAALNLVGTMSGRNARPNSIRLQTTDQLWETPEIRQAIKFYQAITNIQPDQPPLCDLV